MGNVEMHDLAPVRDDERKELDISRKVNYKQYCKVKTYFLIKLIAGLSISVPHKNVHLVYKNCEC